MKYKILEVYYENVNGTTIIKKICDLDWVAMMDAYTDVEKYLINEREKKFKYMRKKYEGDSK